MRATERLDQTVYRIIRERRAAGEDRGDLLSMLLQTSFEDDGSFMTDLQVHDEAMTLFLAGHETTANALAWSWYLLAQHPAIYARLRQEAQIGAGWPYAWVRRPPATAVYAAGVERSDAPVSTRACDRP